MEAKWYYNGYTPTLQEYISNAWISISGPLTLIHGYFFVANSITKEASQSLQKYHSIIRWSSMILRLSDDLGTSLVCMLLSHNLLMSPIIKISVISFHTLAMFFFVLFLGWEEKRRCSQVNTMSHVWNRCFWRRCSQTHKLFDWRDMEEAKWR